MTVPKHRPQERACECRTRMGGERQHLSARRGSGASRVATLEPRIRASPLPRSRGTSSGAGLNRAAWNDGCRTGEPKVSNNKMKWAVFAPHRKLILN